MNVMDRQSYPDLEWGCTAVLPIGLRCAWGARAACKRGEVDIPHDRCGFFGDAEDRWELSAWLNDNLPKLRERIAYYHQRGSLGESGIPQAYVWEDFVGMIFGWYRDGYLYLAAFIHAHAPGEIENPLRPGEMLRGFVDESGVFTQGADRMLAIWDKVGREAE